MSWSKKHTDGLTMMVEKEKKSYHDAIFKKKGDEWAGWSLRSEYETHFGEYGRASVSQRIRQARIKSGVPLPPVGLFVFFSFFFFFIC